LLCNSALLLQLLKWRSAGLTVLLKPEIAEHGWKMPESITISNEAHEELEIKSIV
jgi:hypothetical protein